MSEQKIISEEALRAGIDAVLGIDPSQAPTDPEALSERLTVPQKGVAQALTLLLNQGNAKHMKRATPLVFSLLESASRAYPEEFKDELPMKTYVAGIAAVGLEATETVKANGAPAAEVGIIRAKQPALVKFIDEQVLSEHSFAQKLTKDERTGVYALLLGTVRAIDRALAGAEKPAVAAKLPGRNDPCHCGSGKKFKKCHAAA